MNVPLVRLKPLTAANWKDCAGLKVAPGQEGFLPANLYSIAEAQFYEGASSRAIYLEPDTLVGYCLYGRDVTTGKWKVFRLMIDRVYQGQGCGEAALRAILTELSQEPGGEEVLICYQEANQAARRLYARFGFVEQSITPDGKITALYRRAGN